MTHAARTVLLWVVGAVAAVLAATVAVQAVTAPQPVPLLTAGQDDFSPDPTVTATATAEATTDDNPLSDDGPTHHATPDDNPTSHATPDDSRSDDPTDDATDDDVTTDSDAAVETRTVTSVGGSAAFRFDGSTIEVLWSTPEPGFHVEIHRDAPGDVDVRFESDSHESRIKADNENGTLRIRVEERVED